MTHSLFSFFFVLSPTPKLLPLHWCCIDSSLLTLLICTGFLSHKYFKSMFSGFWKQTVSRKPVSFCVMQALSRAAFVSPTSYMTGSVRLRPRPSSPDKVNCCLIVRPVLPELREASSQQSYQHNNTVPKCFMEKCFDIQTFLSRFITINYFFNQMYLL